MLFPSSNLGNKMERMGCQYFIARTFPLVDVGRSAAGKSTIDVVV